VDWSEVTAITTGLLAVATFMLALFAWRGIVENKRLIEATKTEADLLWANAVPYLAPDAVNPGWIADVIPRGLMISYAAGTIPARAVVAWMGWKGEVWVGRHDLMTLTKNKEILQLERSRAGSEPPQDWDQWLRREPDGLVTYRLVMRWSGPGDHVTERAWWLSNDVWAEVAESLRG